MTSLSLIYPIGRCHSLSAPADDRIRIERFKDIDIACCRFGSGRQLVMIHGLAQDYSIWSEVQEDLSDYSTLAYDIRGHGRSSLGNASGTLEQLGEDLIALLGRVGGSTCVGFSLGGAIALWAAAERPDLVHGVAAIATSSVVGSAAAAALTDRIEIVETGDPVSIRSLLLSDTQSQLGNSGTDPEPITAKRIEAVSTPAGYINAARAVLSMRDISLTDQLPKISAPVLVVNGEHDAWCPRRAAEIMLRQLPNASFVELSGVGHLITDDNPHALSAVIRRWLESEERP